MNKKLYVVYHCTNFVPFKTFLKFLNNYRKFRPGVTHKLIICFKNLNKTERTNFKNKIKNISYIEYIDTNKLNDFDLGSYFRIAKEYKKAIFLFLSGHCYPIKNDWLKLFKKHYRANTIIASTGSYESMHSLPFNIRNNFLKNIYFKLILLINFYKFPNPHFRTSCFMISANNLLKYQFNSIRKKLDTNIIESGKKSLTNFFKKKNIKIYIVNSDGKLFLEKEWKHSETYAFKNQTKLIISDNRTRKYYKLTNIEKKNKEIIVWGRN